MKQQQQTNAKYMDVSDRALSLKVEEEGSLNVK